MFGFSFDANYVRLLTDGDSDTEQHFHSYFGRLLLIKLRQRLKSPQEILDARQETLLRVLVSLRRKRSLEHPERFGAFVNAVCNNVLLEMARTSRRTVPLSDDADLDVPSEDVSDNPETTLVTAEQQARVREVLGQLSDRDRQLLQRIILDEEDKDSVCEEVGVGREYLRVLLHRAKARFRDLYEARQVGETN